jgi:hypothetical protein
MATPIVAPLTVSVTPGTWVSARINVSAMPNGFMAYAYLLPQNYSTSFLYPLIFYGHENDEGMNGGSYPNDPLGLVQQNVIDGTFNTIAFRTRYPSIVVVPLCDQTIDGSGSNGNSNFGGYADSTNSGGNEQGINALNQFFVNNFSIDTTRRYTTGDSLGAIGSLAWLVDNNQQNGALKLWTAAMSFSDQLFRPSTPNSNVFPAMTNVPFIAISTPSDNNPSSYDQPAWQFYTGNSNYPTPSSYSSGGVAAIRAGSTSYYYINTTSGVPWDTYRQMNADGGQGTALYDLLFSFKSGTQTPTPTVTPSPNDTVVLAGSGGSIIDSAGNAWTIVSNSVQENGAAAGISSNVIEIAYVNSTVWQENNSGLWWSWNGSSWPGSGTTTSPLPTTPTPPPSPTATRTFYNNPGMDGSYCVTPFATTAAWITSGAAITTLRNGSNASPTGYLHCALNGQNPIPWYIGQATDPAWTVTDGTMTITVHLPAGAVPENGSPVDNAIGGPDLAHPYRIWSINVTTMNTTTNTITGNILAIDDGSGHYFCDQVTGQKGFNNNGLLINDYDLTQANADASYVVPHMLAYDLDPSQVGLALAWPLNNADSGAAGGPLPQGLTIGIPASQPRPTGMSRGQAFLFDQMQHFGGIMYNLSGNGCWSLNVTSPTNPANNALITDISNNMGWVAQFLCILNYTPGVTGAQYSLATVKGMAPGGTNAFPAPPPLDLTPTNGVNIAPSSFGAWYANNSNQTAPASTFNGVATGFNVTPTNTVSTTLASLTCPTPTQQNANAPFAVTGAIQGYTTAPVLNFEVDAGAFAALPTGATVSSTAFTFTCPGLAAGSHTITIRDANATAVVVSTGSFSVVAAITPVITPAVPSLPATGKPFTQSGTLANYAAAPSGLTYSDNGSAPVALPTGAVVTTTTFSFLHPGLAAGAVTTVISDGTNQGQASYTVTAIGGTSANQTTATPGTGFFVDTAGNRWTVTAGGQVALNGVVDTTTASVIEIAWVSGVIWQENSSATWFSKASAAAAWSTGTTTSPLAGLPTFTINAISSPQPNTTFVVTGSVANVTSAPTLNYSDNSGTATAFPPGSTVTTTTFSFTHPGMPAGSDTLTISDGTHPTTISYAVVSTGWTSLPATTNLTNTIPGLVASTAYDIEVYATNSVGQGPVSTILTVSTIAPAVVIPGAPTGLASTAITTTTVSLSWVAPATGTAPFTYAARSSPHGANTWTNGPTGSALTAQITGLTASTSYDFEIAAVNSAGQGAESAILTVSTTSVAAPTVTWLATAGSMTLSTDKLTATAGGTAGPGTAHNLALSSTAVASGKVSFEVTMTTVSQNSTIGLVNASFVSTDNLGSDANSIGYYMSTGVGSQAAQTVYQSNNPLLSPSGNAPAADVAGAVFTFCCDLIAELFWVTGPSIIAAYGANAWNDSATANPGTGVGGIPIGLTGPLSIACNSEESGAVFVLNAGSSTFSRAARIPSTFPAWNGTGVVVVAPGQVTGLAAGTPSNTSVGLSWSVPATGTPPYTYNILRSAHNSGSFVNVGTSTTTAFTAAGLTASTAYDFEVYAANSAGNGATSSLVTVTTAATSTLPGAPSGVSASGATSSSMTLTWTAPTTGSAATGYQVQYKLATAGTYTNFSPTVAPAVTLLASNPAGSITDSSGGVWTIVSGVVQLNGSNAATSSAVIELVYVSNVMWQENSALNWWSWTGSAWVGGTSTGPVTTPTQTVTGLTASTTYNFQVLAFNGSGNGPPSSPAVSAATTAASVGTGNFTVNGTTGFIHDPNGNIFIPKGINIGDGNTGANFGFTNYGATPLSTLIPGINIVRLNTGFGSGGSTSSATPYPNSHFLPMIEYATGYLYNSTTGAWTSNSNEHVVVYMEDHDGNSSYLPTDGSNNTESLAQCVAQYQGWATFAKGNPYFWIGTLNEMGTPDTTYNTINQMSAVHLALYNGVRGTGNNNIFGIMMGVGGSNPSTVGAAAGFVVGDYASMTGVIWELHWYPANLNATDALANIQGAVFTSGGGPGGSGIIAAQTIGTADGPNIPCLFGEWGAGNGDSTGGSSAGITQAIISIQAQGHGSTAWQYGDGNASGQWEITAGNGNTPNPTLTGWGNQVATVCATNTPTPTPPPPPPGNESPPGTTIAGGSSTLINASATPGTAGNANTIGISGTGTILVNGVNAGGAGVTLIGYIAHTAFQFNGSNWFGPIIVGNTGSQIASSPLPTILLSAKNVASGAASNTVVGAITVTTGTGTGTIATGVYTWTLSIGAGSAAGYVISGTNLVTSATPPVAGNVVIVATNSTVTGSPFSATFSITVGATSGLTIPPALAANGLSSWKVAFFDDFTTTNTITGSLTANSGFNWYPGGVTDTPVIGSNWNVLTTTQASAISNGNTGGGPNASPSGGIFQILGSPKMTFNANWQTVPLVANTPVNYWYHAYFEAYIQFIAGGQSTTGGWPAFWSWSVQGNAANVIEIDFMELDVTNGTGFGVPSAWTISDPGGGVTIRGSGNLINADNEWHTYGCLWQGTGTGTGALSFYVDNVLLTTERFGNTGMVNGKISTGSGGIVPDMENIAGQYITLGCGVGWTQNVDWVRVFTASGGHT